MARIFTFVRRRLERLRRRSQRQLHEPQLWRSTRPFRYGVSLRIHNIGAQHENITLQTGIVPTLVHRKGDARGRKKPSVWEQDIWVLDSPLGEHASISEHLKWLITAITPHMEYFKILVLGASSADICLGCLSESAFPFLEVDAAALGIVSELKLGLTFNFTCL